MIPLKIPVCRALLAPLHFHHSRSLTVTHSPLLYDSPPSPSPIHCKLWPRAIRDAVELPPPKRHAYTTCAVCNRNLVPFLLLGALARERFDRFEDLRRLPAWFRVSPAPSGVGLRISGAFRRGFEALPAPSGVGLRLSGAFRRGFDALRRLPAWL